MAPVKVMWSWSMKNLYSLEHIIIFDKQKQKLNYAKVKAKQKNYTETQTLSVTSQAVVTKV